MISLLMLRASEDPTPQRVDKSPATKGKSPLMPRKKLLIA
jgi:hypothetical protein